MEIVPFNAPLSSYDDIDISRKDFSDKVALIDADYLKHYVAAAMYKLIMDEGEGHSLSLVNQQIDYYLDRDIFSRFEAKAYIFCFSAPSKQVFRHSIAQEKKYKGHRENQKDYTYYLEKYDDMAHVYEYINDRYPTLYFDDLEADDLVSFLQDPERTFIYSNDKDLKQVPGYHYIQEQMVLRYVSEEEGMKMLFNQILIGDSTDNFGGLAGFGKVGLQKFIDENPNRSAQEMFYAVIKKYIDKHGLMNGIDTFVEMWSIASMKIDRGQHFKDKYASAYLLIEELLK